MRLILSLCMVLSLALPALAEDACPLKLQESQIHELVVAQSRDRAEQAIAQALRANRELGELHDKAAAELKKVTAELAALKPAKPKEDPKP